MITGIKENEHWFTDYTYIPLVFAAPKLVGFKEEKQVASLCYALSAAVQSYSLLTNAKWGLIKIISYKIHAGLDFSSGLVSLAALQYIKPKSKRARNTLLLMGFTGLVVGTLSLIGSKKS